MLQPKISARRTNSASVILTRDQLAGVVEYFMRSGAFAFDVESVGEYRGIPTQNEVTWLSLATHGAAVVIPMGHPIGDRVIGETKEPRADKNGKIRHFKVPIWEPAPTQLRRFEVFAALKPLFFSDRTKIGHNASFDLLSIAKYYGGEVPPPPYADTIVLSWLLDENRLNGLKPRVKQEFGLDYDKENVGKCVEKHPFSTVATYSRLDSLYTWLLYQRMLPLVEPEGLAAVWRLETDVLPVLLEAGLAGAPVSVPWLEQLKVEFSAELEQREAAVYKAAGQIFNIGSSQQKAQVLYGPKRDGGQGLKPKSLTDGGFKKQKIGQKLLLTDYSTDAKALSGYKSNAVVKAILGYQESSKLLSTYVYGYLGNPEKNKPCIVFDTERGTRIFGTLRQYGTATGRFSSSEPNLQNIPIRTEAGAKIRRSFQAPPNHKLIVADYGQIELVILAHYAGDGALRDGFMQGIDPHTMTAALVFGVGVDEVTKQMRSAAKALNFAICYGAGPQTVAEMAGVTVAQAKELLAEHRRQFPEIYRLKTRVLNSARARSPHYIRTLTGRKRRLPDLSSRDDAARSLAERQCFNSLIQGGNADITKIAMVRLYAMLHQAEISAQARLILTVHDELVVEAHDDVVERAEAIVREAMLGEGIQKLLSVPLTSDVKVVDHWAAAK